MADPRARSERTDGAGPGPSEAKKNCDEEAAAESMHHDGSFGRYMQLKVVKLREQFDAQQLQNVAAKSDIFRGVSIHVNGFTRPSHAELKQLMALHGGRFENYLYRDSVTHIICSNLPDTKIKQLAHERKPIPIVRPEWVVASINAGRLLPISDFQLEPLSGAHPNQRRLFDFKRHAAPQLAPEELYPVLQQQQEQQGRGQQHLEQQQQQGQEQQAQQRQVRGQDVHWCGRLEEPGPPSIAAQPALAEEDPGVRPTKRLRTHSPVPHEQARGPGDGEAGPDPRQPHPHPHPYPDPHPQGQAQRPPDVQQHQPPGGWGTGPGPPSAARYGAPPARPPSRSPSPGPNPAPNPNPNLNSTPNPKLDPQAHALRDQSREQASPVGALPAVRGAAVAPAGVNAAAQAPQRSPGPGPGLRPAPGPSGPSGPQAAQALAAELRAASDLARGPPRSTRTDPRFMETFFRASRLHFIGTWKARIEALMAEVEGTAPKPAPYAKGTERVIMHVDMDCFFASVAAVGRPELAGRPVAVCHSNSARGTGEVSSANYLARGSGVRADMFIAEAKRRCPDIVVVPYEFEKYQEISEKVYRILMSYTSVVQPVSCDEAYLDVTGLDPDPEQLAARLRAEIASTTQCTASAGIGHNLLIAKLATRRGKPNGQFRVTPGSVLEFLGDLKVDELPGVGWSMASKLEELGITTVRQVWSSSRTRLLKQLGAKVGADLWAHAHGQDDRKVEPPKARKSVGAEVNYGIRFEADAAGQAEAERFVGDLAGEVAGRLKAAGVRGRALVLKVKRRQAGAPEPAKFMGHGACDNISRTLTLSRFTDDPADLRREAVALLRALAVPPEELRGLGITVCKLDNDPASHTTRPSAAAPAKLQAPPRTTFDASKPPPWLAYFQRKNVQQQGQQPQPQPQQQQQQEEEEEEDHQQPQQQPAKVGHQAASGRDTSLPGAPAGGEVNDDAVELRGCDDVGRAPPPRAPSPALDLTAPTKSHPNTRPGPTATAAGGHPAGPGAERAAVRPGGHGGDGGDGGGRRAISPGPGPGPSGAGPSGAVERAASRSPPAAAVAAKAVVDVPSWYASLYNEWSPVSVWDQQRQKGRQQLQQQQVLLPSGRSRQSEGPPADGRSEGPQLGGAAASAAASTDQRVQAGLQQPGRGNAAAAAGAAQGTAMGEAAGVTASRRSRLKARLHPVFAALLSQPAAAAAGGGLDGSAAVSSPEGQPAAAVAEAEAAAAAAEAAVASAPARDGADEGGAATITRAEMEVEVEGTAARRRRRFGTEGGFGEEVQTKPMHAPPDGRGGAGARPRQPPPATTLAAMAPPSHAPRPAASGSNGAVAAGAPAALRPPPRLAKPGPPAISTASAAGVSVVSGGGGVHGVESIDLSVDIGDGSEDDYDGGGGDGRLAGVSGGDGGDDGGGGGANHHVVEVWEAGGDTADAASPQRAALAHRTGTAPARPAHSETTTGGGPAVSTSAAASGSAAGRWPAGFLRPGMGAAGVGGTRAGSSGGGSGARGRGGGSSGGRARGAARAGGGRGREASGRGGGGGRAGGSGAAARTQAGGGAGGGVAGGLTAIQIDRSVLAELPPEVRREVEREYGLLPAAPLRPSAAAAAPGPSRPAKRARQDPAAAAQGPPQPAAQPRHESGSIRGVGAGPEPAADEPVRRGGGSGGGGGGYAANARGDHAPAQELQRRAADGGVGGEQVRAGGNDGAGAGAGPGAEGGPCCAPAGHAPAATMPTSMAEVDLEVLEELPPELRSEITAALRDRGLAAGAEQTGGIGAGLRQPQPQPHQQPQPQQQPAIHVHRAGAAAGSSGANGAAGHSAPSGPAAAAGRVQQNQIQNQIRAGACNELLQPHGARRMARPQQPAAGEEPRANSGTPEVMEVMDVAALPAEAGPHQRLAAAAAHMFRGAPSAGRGPPATADGAEDVLRLLLSAIRCACASAGEGTLHAGGGRDAVVGLQQERDLQAPGLAPRALDGGCNGKSRGAAGAGLLAAVGQGDRTDGVVATRDCGGEHGDTGDGGEEGRVQVTFMALVLWLMGQDHDLEGVAAVLRRMMRAVGASAALCPAESDRARRRMWINAQRTVRLVQEHVQHKYGFKLKL